MFGKKKKESKKKKLDEAANEEGLEQDVSNLEQSQNTSQMSEADKLIMGDTSKDTSPKMSESQKKQLEHLGSVKEKISKILKSSNIEIIDENIGDEYESGSGGGGSAQQQQDYDSLKAIFGGKDDKKSKELTLTIDDFDYTYTGQYLDEFDMMHLKNIKRIRLQNKHAKLIKKIALISSLVLVVVAGAVAAFFLTRETPVYLKSISLNEQEGMYYINDYFDYAGLYIYAEYSDGNIQRIKLKSNHLQDMTGNIVKDGENIQFTGTAPAELKFSYGGLTTNYVIVVENKRASGLAAVYTDGIFNLDAGDYINENNLRLLLKYTNFNSTFIDYTSSTATITINNVACTYDNEHKSFVASVSTKPSLPGEQSTAEIVITSNGYSLKITDVEGQFFVETVNE